MCKSLASTVSTSPLEERTPVAVNKRDVHRVERSTFVGQATVCKVYSKLLHAFACFNTSACARSRTFRGWWNVFVPRTEPFNVCHVVEIIRVFYG